MNGYMTTGNILEEVGQELGITDMKSGVWESYLETLPQKALSLGIRIVLAILVFCLGTWLIKLLRKIVKRSLQRTRADVGVIQFLDSLLKVVLLVLLIFLIASGFGMDAASIVALVGSMGVAIGLAIQGSLSNFVGGVLILLLKPFKVGDYIRDAAGNEGTVMQIQIFYTRLSTMDNRIVILPNGTLANSGITNVTEAPDRRLDISVGIAYDADISRAKEVLTQMLSADDAVIQKKEHFVFVDELGDYAVKLGIRCWVSQGDYWTAKWRLTERTKLTLDENRITIPFPQLDIHQNIRI